MIKSKEIFTEYRQEQLIKSFNREKNELPNPAKDTKIGQSTKGFKKISNKKFMEGFQ